MILKILRRWIMNAMAAATGALRGFVVGFEVHGNVGCENWMYEQYFGLIFA
jgi:hypothetical protein